MQMDNLIKILEDAGVFQYGVIDTSEVELMPEVREMCAANTCRGYGKTWACPPGLGTLDECRDRIRKYEKMLVFTVKCELEDSFDYEGMMEGMEKFKQVCRTIDGTVKSHLDSYIILSNEGCDLCKQCTYPDAPCRFPDRVHGSVEGNGILVSRLAKQVGVNYINGQNTVTYFGAILYNEDSNKINMRS